MDVRILRLILCVCVFVVSSSGFNIDTKDVLTFRGPEGSLFGYSAVMYTHEDKKMVVVGAPKANFTDGTLPEVKTPGNVYKCSLNLTLGTQDECEPLNLRQSAQSRWPDETEYFEEDNELLGATMTLTDDFIIACAPLWKNAIPMNRSGLVHAIGRCFNINKGLNGSYSDGQFKNRDLPHKNESEFAQIGFSLSSRQSFGDPDFNVAIGAPGFNLQRGGFMMYRTNITTYPGQFVGLTLDPIESSLNGNIEIESLFGYSIASGQIPNTGDNCREAVVIGTPHFMMSRIIVGTVVVVCVRVDGTSKRSILFKQQLLGPQPAGGFGSAVEFDDINGDGVNDLIVGAPGQFDTLPDAGAVHVFTGLLNESKAVVIGGTDMQNYWPALYRYIRQEIWSSAGVPFTVITGLGATILNTTAQVLKGSALFGRFGTAVKCIGDIDKDGYIDLAVSAPYENDGQGALYIYHGGSVLVLSQKILASDIDIGLKSFGWFIGISHDIDSNNYTDMIIGSYDSDSVTVLRSRPIISLDSSLEVYPKEIPLNSSGQDCQDGTFRPCVSVRVCLSYNGTDVPNQILVGLKFKVDAERTQASPPKTSRLHLFYNGTNLGSNNVPQQNIFVDFGLQKCLNFSAIVEPVNRDFYASLQENLVIKMDYGLTDQNIPGIVEPILALYNPTVAVESANFSSGCEGSCKPNLHVNSSASTQEIILDVSAEVIVTVVLTNRGEQSHSTWITMATPNNTIFISYSQPTDQVTDIVDCSHSQASGLIQCELRSLFYNKQGVIVNFRFYVSRDTLVPANETLGTFDQRVTFRTNAYTTGDEADYSDNNVEITINTRLYSSLELTGASKPEQLTVSDNENGYLYFVHTYSELNQGPSPLFNSTIEICIPVTNDTGTQIMDANDIQILTTNPTLTWELTRFPGWVNEENTNNTQQDNSTLDHAANLPLLEDETKGIQYITCDTTDPRNIAVVHVHIEQLEREEKDTFSVTLNISESSLEFRKRDGIVYKTKATLQIRNDSRYYTTAVNISYEISSEIFPKREKPSPTEVNLWVIVGGSVGGLALLIIVGVILYKCKFFERKKRDDVKKRRTLYLAEVREQKARTMALSTHIYTDLQNGEEHSAQNGATQDS